MNIAIIMSTYNGEKYLEEQISSLQNQTYKNWNLYIRDDGSNDNTVSLIRQNEYSDNRIHYINDSKNNLGPMRSFLTLLSSIEADYYFFCDQDDYWKNNKLEEMLVHINNNSKLPQLVYCNLKCVDKNLNPINNDFDNLIGKISGLSRFIGNDMPGCVMLINKALRDIAISINPNYDYLIMHDWWLALIAETFGKITFVNKRMVLYRQHGNNSVGAGYSGALIKKIFHKDVINKQRKLVKITYNQSQEFLRVFGDTLPFEKRNFLKDYMSCKNGGVINKLKFLKKYDLKGSSKLREFAYKLVFVLS